MRARIMKRRLAVAGILAAAAAAVLVAVPPERALGSRIRLVYLHGALAESAIACFLIAAVLVFAGAARRRPARWAHPLFSAGLRLWGLQMALGVLGMRLLWGGFVWSDPKVRAGLALFLVALGAEVLFLSSRHLALRVAAYAATALMAAFTFLSASDVLHPDNAILGSRSPLLAVLFVMLALATFGIGLLYADWRRSRAAEATDGD